MSAEVRHYLYLAIQVKADCKTQQTVQKLPQTVSHTTLLFVTTRTLKKPSLQ